MNKLTHQILITVWAMLLPLFCMGENTLTLTVDNNPVCQGTEVQFSATAQISHGTITKYTLSKDGVDIQEIVTNTSTVNFAPVTADTTANYRATVTYNGLTRNYVDSNIINLVVNLPATVTIEEEACDSIVWHNSIYYESGHYTYHTQTVHGCDSIVHLNLTINSSSVTYETQEACDSIVWHGVTYYESGEYIFETETVHGCDSIVHLNLTINRSCETYETQVACDSIVWHGVTYYESGEYTFETETVHGCDSIIHLNLTINNSYEYDEEPVSTCDYYEWHDSIYYESGYYTYTTETMYGCDSIMHINLTINKAPEIELSGDDFICDNSESVYTLTTYPNNGLSYKWTVDGGTIAAADTTETVTIIWNKNNTEGNISVTVTNKTTGCYTNAAKTVQIQSFVNEDLNKIVAKKNSNGIPYVLIYPNPSNEYHYQWYRYDLPLEGETGQYLYLNNNTSNEIDSIYRVYVGYISDWNSLVCGKYSDYYINSQISAKDRMTISPNPVKHCEVFSIYMDNNNDNSLINIFSSEGNVVFKSEMAGNPIKIHAGFPKGIYIIELIDNHGDKHFGKIIIK